MEKGIKDALFWAVSRDISSEALVELGGPLKYHGGRLVLQQKGSNLPHFSHPAISFWVHVRYSALEPGEQLRQTLAQLLMEASRTTRPGSSQKHRGTDCRQAFADAGVGNFRCT